LEIALGISRKLLVYKQAEHFANMTRTNWLQSARGAWTHVFVRYGSGAEWLRPITQTKWWNTASWVLIVMGLIGWAVFIFWPY
jgi:hypothetical protein